MIRKIMMFFGFQPAWAENVELAVYPNGDCTVSFEICVRKWATEEDVNCLRAKVVYEVCQRLGGGYRVKRRIK